MTNPNEKLLPCPFCGNKEVHFERLGTPLQSCIVECGNCGARHESSDEDEQCGSSWNARILTTASEAAPIIYQHNDGRYGLSFGPAQFAVGDPAWHGVPVDVVEGGAGEAGAVPMQRLFWRLSHANVIALANEISIGATTMGGPDDGGETPDLILEVRPAGTVADDDGKWNAGPILAISLAEYPDEGVYPIDPTDPTGDRQDAAPPIQPSSVAQPSAPAAEPVDRIAPGLSRYGNLIRNLRVIASVTLMDMAKSADQSPSYLSARECRRAAPDHNDMRQAAQFFAGVGLPIDLSILHKAAQADVDDPVDYGALAKLIPAAPTAESVKPQQQALSMLVANAHTIADMVHSSDPNQGPIEALHQAITMMADQAAESAGPQWVELDDLIQEFEAEPGGKARMDAARARFRKALANGVRLTTHRFSLNSAPTAATAAAQANSPESEGINGGGQNAPIPPDRLANAGFTVGAEKRAYIAEAAAEILRGMAASGACLPFSQRWAAGKGADALAQGDKGVQSMDSPADETQALRDMLDSSRAASDRLRDALGVAYEPHQSLHERVLEAAQRAKDAPQVAGDEDQAWLDALPGKGGAELQNSDSSSAEKSGSCDEEEAVLNSEPKHWPSPHEITELLGEYTVNGIISMWEFTRALLGRYAAAPDVVADVVLAAKRYRTIRDHPRADLRFLGVGKVAGDGLDAAADKLAEENRNAR